jgi:hypothetical protein
MPEKTPYDIKCAPEPVNLLPPQPFASVEPPCSLQQFCFFDRDSVLGVSRTGVCRRETVPMRKDGSIAPMSNPMYKGEPPYTGAWADCAYDPETPGWIDHPGVCSDTSTHASARMTYRVRACYRVAVAEFAHPLLISPNQPLRLPQTKSASRPRLIQSSACTRRRPCVSSQRISSSGAGSGSRRAPLNEVRIARPHRPLFAPRRRVWLRSSDACSLSFFSSQQRRRSSRRQQRRRTSLPHDPAWEGTAGRSLAPLCEQAVLAAQGADLHPCTDLLVAPCRGYPARTCLYDLIITSGSVGWSRWSTRSLEHPLSRIGLLDAHAGLLAGTSGCFAGQRTGKELDVIN